MIPESPSFSYGEYVKPTHHQQCPNPPHSGAPKDNSRVSISDGNPTPKTQPHPSTAHKESKPPVVTPPPTPPQPKPQAHHEQNQPIAHPTPPTPQPTKPTLIPVATITQQQFMQNAKPLITEQVIKAAAEPQNHGENPILQFHTKNPIEVTLDGKNLEVRSFVPYHLKNVDLYMTSPSGEKILVGKIDEIPQWTLTTIPLSSIPGIALVQGESAQPLKTPVLATSLAYTPDFSVTASTTSDQTTQDFFNNMANMTVNLNLILTLVGGLHNGTWGVPTVQDAKLLFEAMLDLSACLSSHLFQQQVLHPYFPFIDGPWDFKPNVTLGPQGQVNPKYEKYVLSNETVYKNYTYDRTVQLDIMNPKAPDHESGMGYGGVFHNGGMGVMESDVAPNPGSIYLTNKVIVHGIANNNLFPLTALWHEFGHVNGYGHNGDMTYPHGWFLDPEGDENVNPYPPYNYEPRSDASYDQAPNGSYQLAGMVGVGIRVWAQLGQEGKLPINYAQLAKNPPQSPVYNTQAAKDVLPLNTTLATTANMAVLQSATTAIFRQSNKNNNASGLVGANFIMGYQKYFNDYIGWSGYGIVKYNYAKANNLASTINQVAFGVGANILLDFYTKYSTIKRMGRAYKRLSSSFGMFAGLRSVWKGYGLLNHFVNSGNINLATGFNYRVGHSKYSIGATIPLIQHSVHLSIPGANVAINDGASHLNLFFNYGWVF